MMKMKRLLHMLNAFMKNGWTRFMKKCTWKLNITGKLKPQYLFI